MGEPRWDELVRSPLDADIDKEQGRPISMWVVVLIAAAVGLAVGAAIGMVGGSEQNVATGASSTTATTVPVTLDPVVPDGYVRVGDTSLGTLGSFGIDGHTYVIVGEATLSSADPGATAAFRAGRWALVDDGGAEETALEIVDPVAPGVRLLDYEVREPASTSALAVWSGTAVEARAGCNGCGSRSIDRSEGDLLIEFSGLPAVMGKPLTVDLAGGLGVRVDSLVVAEEWGHAEWALTGDSDAAARVAIEVAFIGTDDPSAEGDNPTRLVPYDQAPIQYGVGHPRSAPPFARTGSIRLTRVGEPIAGGNQPTGLSVSWSVEWIDPVGEPIPLASP